MQVATLYPDVSRSRGTLVRAGSEITSMSAAVMVAPFKAMRAVYWAVDHDAKVRARGFRTVGRVTNTRTVTQTHTDCEGDEYTTTERFIDYTYDDQDGTPLRGKKKVGSLVGVQKGGMIDVYYMVDDPRDSALEGSPQTLPLKVIERRALAYRKAA